MAEKTHSVLVVGFNTRPLVFSLSEAGYKVFAVDFFGDLDLYPHVEDNIIVAKELDTSYSSLKDKYSKYLVDFTIKMLQKYQNINLLLIGSGLDNAYEGREAILKEINNNDLPIKNINNNLEIIKKARDIEGVYETLKSQGYNVPISYSYDVFKSKKTKLNYPFILKKKRSAGGINVFKIKNEEELNFQTNSLNINRVNRIEWLIQEYLEGTPVSCTTISNGRECEIVTINRQIIGEKFLNAPKDFMYCGNIVPANLLRDDEVLISEISINLTKKLNLRGINGFDFVLKDHYPYLMEINPRIPGSIRVSEIALDLNLLDLHVKSFDISKWEYIKNLIKSAKPKCFVTKLIFFAPREVDKYQIAKINRINFVHDKTEPTDKNIKKSEPICTILYKDKSFSNSYFGALKVLDKIKEIVG